MCVCVFPGDMALTKISNPSVSHVSGGKSRGENGRVQGNMGPGVVDMAV